MDRLKIFQVAVYIVAALIVSRLAYWQFFAKVDISTQELSQDEIPAARGEIYTSDDFPIVANQEAFLIYGKPREVKNPEEVAKVLAPYLISEKFATREGQLTDAQKDQKEKET